MILWSDVEKHRHDNLKTLHSLNDCASPANVPQALGRPVEAYRARYEKVPK